MTTPNDTGSGRVTIHVDGDLLAVPFIKDLNRAGLRLVQENGETWLRRAHAKPMDCINDVAAIVDRLRGVANTLSVADPQDLDGGTLARIGSAVENLLEQASDRLADARESPPDAIGQADKLNSGSIPESVETVLKGLEAAMSSEHPTFVATRPALMEKLREVLRDEPEETEKTSDNDRWRAMGVYAFLGNVRPLEGCEFNWDGFYSGQRAIVRLATALDVGGECENTILDAIDILFFLSSIQPIDRANNYTNGGQESVGFNEVLDHVRDLVTEYHEKHEKND